MAKWESAQSFFFSHITAKLGHGSSAIGLITASRKEGERNREESREREGVKSSKREKGSKADREVAQKKCKIKLKLNSKFAGAAEVASRAGRGLG